MPRLAWTVFFVVALWLGATGTRADETLQSGGTATVVVVVDGDTVVLDRQIEGSSRVRLVGIQAPKLPLGRKNFKAWPLAGASKEALEKIVLGKQVNVRFGGRRMDRHSRLLAHLYIDGDIWAQGELLAAGMARVYSFPDNRALISEMLDQEQQARADRRGIWADRFYAVRQANAVNNLIGTFQLVEGDVVDAQTVKGRTYLNFSNDWRSDFTISVNKRARKLFTATDTDPLNLKGRVVRVRGWIKKRNGPMIEVSHPEQIEIVR